MTFTRSIAAIAAALALTASAAQAQNIMFSSTGAFNGGGCDVLSGDLNSTSCQINAAASEESITLKYTFGTVQTLNNFGNANFGFFTTTGMGPATFNDVLFSLTVTQTSPSNGTESVSANINGEVSAIQGGLQWGPIDPSTFSIGDVNYSILVDAGSNSVSIDPPGLNGVTSSEQTIRGFVTTTTSATVPEPATFALMLAGMVGIALTARRRAHTA